MEQIQQHEWVPFNSNVGLYKCKHCSWKLSMTITHDLYIHPVLPSTRKEPKCITRKKP